MKRKRRGRGIYSCRDTEARNYVAAGEQRVDEERSCRRGRDRRKILSSSAHATSGDSLRCLPFGGRLNRPFNKKNYSVRFKRDAESHQTRDAVRRNCQRDLTVSSPSAMLYDSKVNTNYRHHRDSSGVATRPPLKFFLRTRAAATSRKIITTEQRLAGNIMNARYDSAPTAEERGREEDNRISRPGNLVTD